MSSDFKLTVLSLLYICKRLSPYYLFQILRPPALPRRLQRSTIGRTGLNRRVRYGNGCVPGTHRHRKFRSSVRALGLSGLEPPTSRLSGVRSNQLSYKPIYLVAYSL